MRGVTKRVYSVNSTLTIFQLTRLMRGVTYVTKTAINYMTKFQLTRLMRGVTPPRLSMKKLKKDFNSHASCEA